MPTHAAESFQRTTTPRTAPTASSTIPDGNDGSGELEGEYAAFVRRSEARDVARELYGENAAQETAPRRKFNNRVVKSIVEYVKPTREDR